MDMAGKDVISEDEYKHLCLTRDLVVASCGPHRSMNQLFTDATEGWAVKSASLPTGEFLKSLFSRWYQEPPDPDGSLPAAFALFPEADGMGALIMEWGNPKIDVYHVAPNDTPLILSFSPTEVVSQYVMSRLRFSADHFCNLPRSEFENAMRSAVGQVFAQATKLDSRINDRVRIATRGAVVPAQALLPNLDGQLFRRITAVSSGNQCQTGSIVSGAVNNAVSTTSNQSNPTTTETVIATLTLTANGGYVEIQYGGYIFTSSGGPYNITLRIRKTNVSGSILGTTAVMTSASVEPDWSLRGIDASPGSGSVTYVITCISTTNSSNTTIYGNGFAANREV
jgi:hypothetical protein